MPEALKASQGPKARRLATLVARPRIPLSAQLVVRHSLLSPPRVPIPGALLATGVVKPDDGQILSMFPTQFEMAEFAAEHFLPGR